MRKHNPKLGIYRNILREKCSEISDFFIKKIPILSEILREFNKKLFVAQAFTRYRSSKITKRIKIPVLQPREIPIKFKLTKLFPPLLKRLHSTHFLSPRNSISIDQQL